MVLEERIPSNMCKITNPKVFKQILVNPRKIQLEKTHHARKNKRNCR